MGDPLAREVLLSFWKVHILHHAAKEPFHGQWMIHELAHHGYRLSPGTIYPILARMEKRGWLRSTSQGGPKSRRDYRITPQGRRVLQRLAKAVSELNRECGAR